MTGRTVVGWRYQGERYTTLALRHVLIQNGTIHHDVKPWDIPVVADQMTDDGPTPIWTDDDDAMAPLIDLPAVLDPPEPAGPTWAVTFEVKVKGTKEQADKFAEDLGALLSEDTEVVSVLSRRHW